ncbi:MAG: hypothetical protein AAF573_10685, partial [Bacteroidota bacterium]
MKKDSLLLYVCFVFLSIFLCTCKKKNLANPSINPSWNIPMESFTIDSCQGLRSTPSGLPILPPTAQSDEIHVIAFDPLDDNALYLTTWERKPLSQSQSHGSDLYRVDLSENTSTFVTHLSDFGGSRADLELNGKADLLSLAMGEGGTVFNIPSLELVTENLPKSGSTNVTWMNDSTFWRRVSIFQNGQPIPHWMLYAKDGTSLDTFEFSFRRVSASRNQKSVFSGLASPIYYGRNQSLYVYDQVQKMLVDSMQKVIHPNLISEPNGQPFWLSDQEVLLFFGRIFMI